MNRRAQLRLLRPSEDLLALHARQPENPRQTPSSRAHRSKSALACHRELHCPSEQTVSAVQAAQKDSSLREQSSVQTAHAMQLKRASELSDRTRIHRRFAAFVLSTLEPAPPRSSAPNPECTVHSGSLSGSAERDIATTEAPRAPQGATRQCNDLLQSRRPERVRTGRLTLSLSQAVFFSVRPRV